MKVGKTHSLIIFALSFLVFLPAFWMTLAPTQLGGRVTYVIVDGSSMEPGYTFGDLVLVRSAANYAVGDAVVYHDANMESFVFHRIVGMELDRFVLQGDNNSWLDSYRPVREEIVGKLWVSVPRLGRVFEWLRVPLHASLAVGLLGGLVMLDLFRASARNKKHNSPAPMFNGFPQFAALGAAILALLFLSLGIYSFVQPLERPAETISYQQEGYYYYSATGTPGVYDTDVIRSGEPVFPKLTCFLNVGFTYNILSDRLQGVSGTHKMYARIMDETSGWQRTIPLNTDTSFSGNSYFAMATLDLCQVESIVNLVEEEAGLKQIAYTLEVVTDVSFVASAEGNPVSDSFSPALVFKYDKVHFYLDAPAAQTDPLRSSQPGLVGSSASQPNTISLLGVAVPVLVVRFLALLGFAISALTLLGIGAKMYEAASQSEEALTRFKYGSMLVEVYEQNLSPSSSLVDVATFDDLARIAERHGTMILHMPRNFLHFYFVQTGGTTYRYLISAGKKGVVEEESAQVEATQPSASAADLAVVETPDEKPLMVGNRPIYTYPPQAEILEAERHPKKMQVRPRPQPMPEQEVEYVIETGEIELIAPQPDSVFLRKIKI